MGKIGLTTHVTGTLPVANGGTGIGSYAVGDILYASAANTLAKLTAGTSGYFLKSNGAATAPSWAAVGGGIFQNKQVFTSSGTFTVPSGVTKLYVIMVGGGGGGSATGPAGSAGRGGGGGGYIAGVFSVTPGDNIAVTRGAGGAGGAVGSSGSPGSSSSFLTLSAGGGNGGVIDGAAGGAGGSYGPAYMNDNKIIGMTGYNGSTGSSTNNGGDSACLFGQGGAGVAGGVPGNPGGSYGGGGSGGGGGGLSTAGGVGAPGIVIVYY